MYQPHRMKFGIFMAPFHRIGENPTLAFKRGNLDMVFKNNANAWLKAFKDAGKELPESVKQGLAAMAKAREQVAKS